MDDTIPMTESQDIHESSPWMTRFPWQSHRICTKVPYEWWDSCDRILRIPFVCLAASILAAQAIICFWFIWSPIDHLCSWPHAQLAALSWTPYSCSTRNARGAGGLWVSSTQNIFTGFCSRFLVCSIVLSYSTVRWHCIIPWHSILLMQHAPFAQHHPLA